MQPAPLHALVADAPPGGRAVWRRTSDGVRLRMAWWPGGPNGRVMVFPGRTEVIEKYGRVVADLVSRGYGAFLIDWRGQGLSDRMAADPLLGHVDDFGQFQTDIAAWRDCIAELTDGAGADFVLAHSMGGCIALRALVSGLPARAVAFSAPLWGVPLRGALRRGVGLLTAAGRLAGLDERPVPGAGIEFRLWENPFDNNELTTDAETYTWIQGQVLAHPALRLGAPSIRWLGAVLSETAALSRLPAPPMPAHCGLGTRERVVDPAAIHARMADWPGGRLMTFPGAEHELLMERPETRDAFLAGVFDLFGSAGRMPG